MFGRALNSIGAFGHLAHTNLSILNSGALQPGGTFTQLRYSKHWNPKWKKLRGQKVIRIKLPNYQEKTDDLSPEQIRSKMKEMGLKPTRMMEEKPMIISNTGEIFEPYIPPEGDGKFSIVSKSGAKQKIEFMSKKGKSYLAIKKVRSYDDEFSISVFEEEAQNIYIKTHEAIARKDNEALLTLVTEKSYPEVRHNTLDKTIRWRFLESLELPRMVHARSTSLVTKTNMFAQLTVRFHTRQTLAVYDRFGRLMHGSEIVPKDVLEYVVFEKHLSNEYGIWRIHGKIIPPWMPSREFAARTYIEKQNDPDLEKEEEESTASKAESEVSTVATETKSDSPTHVTA